MKELFSTRLAKRFISDYSLPMPVPETYEEFIEYLTFYENRLGALTKYKDLENIIVSKFESNPEKFVEYYCKVRDEIIEDILKNEDYIEFNKGSMDKYVVKDRPENLPSKNIYNRERINKRYLSVDLKKANIQALKYVNPKILKGAKTYEEFIKFYTDIPYIIESKRTRQVIYGKLNPKRIQTVESFIINEVRKRLNLDYPLITMMKDELVYEIPEDEVIDPIFIKSKAIGFDLNVEVFELRAYALKTKSGAPDRVFYTKGDDFKRLIDLEFSTLFDRIAYKLLMGKELTGNDLKMTFEGYKTTINEEFYVERL